MLSEAGRFAADVIAPLNAVGDKFGTPFKDGQVTTPPGWKEAYTAWAAAGWNGLAAPADYGGQELPHAVNAACVEMWNSASMAFGIGPVLTMAAIDALAAYGTDDAQAAAISSKLISGEWMGTMQLTEPQAGSDVGALRTQARARARDGSYRITGSKIFITYGEHDLTDNIIHFVLARLPDAPPGTKGISLFLIPKILPDGTRNDLRAHSVEHKLGIHASPTCTMVYGDQGGAVGFLIGEEHKGMACDVHHDEPGAAGGRLAGRRDRRARDAAGARLCARAQAGRGRRHHRLPRRQAHAADHARADRAPRARSATPPASPSTARCAAKARPRARPRMSAPRCSRRSPRPSPPISASKSPRSACRCTAAWATSRKPAPPSISATPASPPSTRAPTASRPLDLVARKVSLAGGNTVRLYLNELREIVKAVQASNAPAFGGTAARLNEAVDSLERATQWLLAQKTSDATLAGATPYLRLFGSAAGGCMLAAQALAAQREAGDGAGRTALARFFAENIAVQASGLERSVTEGADSISAADAALSA